MYNENMNHYLFQYEEETVAPPLGALLADHFRSGYGFYGHRTWGTKDWLLIYTMAGSGSFRVSEEVDISLPGDAFLIPPGIPHHYAANEGGGWELLWVHFVPLPEWEDWLRLPRTKEELIRVHVAGERVRSRLEKAFFRLIEDARSGEKADVQLSHLALAEILLLLHREQEERDRTEATDERITLVTRLLLDHLSRKITLPELARAVHLSESRLSHLYKEQTGETPLETLVKLRLQRAAKLLELTSAPVKEIAAEVAFESPFYFSKRFAAYFGVSPTAYRDHARQRGRNAEQQL